MTHTPNPFPVCAQGQVLDHTKGEALGEFVDCPVDQIKPERIRKEAFKVLLQTAEVPAANLSFPFPPRVKFAFGKHQRLPSLKHKDTLHLNSREKKIRR